MIPDAELARTFKSVICMTFCDFRSCVGCPAREIDGDTYKQMYIGDILEVGKRVHKRKTQYHISTDKRYGGD